MLIVKKFGGTSVGSNERIVRVARRCVEEYQKGNDVVVVLSAMGKTTDVLLEQARAINPRASKRELDMLLTTGEQTSVALMAMAIQAMHVPAYIPERFPGGYAYHLELRKCQNTRSSVERILHELSERKIVIITGFQGINKFGDYTTLGRGGSDTTAVALAAALHADACEIYTDVDGVYTADPRIVKNARKLDEITYDEMLDLATSGAGVLHNRSVEMAKKYGVVLVVRSSLNDSEGTVVKEEVSVERMLISGVALDKKAARISVMGVKDEPGIAFKLFNVLAKNNINVDIILQSIGRDNTKDISFTVDEDAADEAIELILENKNRITLKSVNCKKDVAKVSIVGAGMVSNPGVASKMFEALYNVGVNINMISTSEIRITVLVEEKDGEKAMNAIHDAFGLAES